VDLSSVVELLVHRTEIHNPKTLWKQMSTILEVFKCSRRH